MAKFEDLVVSQHRCQLYISDFSLDSNNAKVAGMVRLVKELNANGTLVDGIGIEAHLSASYSP